MFHYFPAPGGPPQHINTFVEDSESIRVEWQPPMEEDQNGDIIYYKLMYVQSKKQDSEAIVQKIENPNEKEFLITGLEKWTEYRVWMLAGTMVGDGVTSNPIEVRTEEDGTSMSYFYLV